MAPRSSRVLFTSRTSVAREIEDLLREAGVSVDVAMYRVSNPQLVRALDAAQKRGLRVRLLTDRGKFEQTPATRELLAAASIPYRILDGRQGNGSKLHHKFAILDGSMVLAGSYNWTLESEEGNFDHLLILPDFELALTYQQEFDRLWKTAANASQG